MRDGDLSCSAERRMIRRRSPTSARIASLWSRSSLRELRMGYLASQTPTSSHVLLFWPSGERIPDKKKRPKRLTQPIARRDDGMLLPGDPVEYESAERTY